MKEIYEFKKIFVPTLIFAMLILPIVELSASEVGSEVDTMSTSKPESGTYAPIHPTAEQVEAAAATDLVEIPDANLEQALADELRVPVGTITVGDMESATKLILDDYGISDISPLSELTNLSDLSLWNNEINDISALGGLTNLSNLG